ncbi:ABC transporter ATP-binding protein [Methylobacterium nodulans]|uniref:ABC transporter related n=1 Tax=Methylobacterium nodulans (strain LMG 21967 / CNCM I-2342 / ORS 2060) TaxID=460265 RepID=B8I9Z2_METNO|nr:ATP-binding cassette domain-containing protein [Methylobacterium nodulans]ACL57220.1 ABC transporter related [Methylobacterium nodulans ORS 2060]
MRCDRDRGLHIEDLRSDLAGPFDLVVPKGQIVTIAGPSGSGKSLFLRMIADLDVNTGRVRLDGRWRSEMPAPEWRRQIPYVAAEPGWWSDAIADHVAPEHRVAAEALAARLGVGARPFAGLVANLSTGERQRLALVRALVRETPALLLDEPTGPLDPVSTTAVEALLRERAAAGAIILMVSHDPGQSERLSARALRMAARRLEAVP